MNDWKKHDVWASASELWMSFHYPVAVNFIKAILPHPLKHALEMVSSTSFPFSRSCYIEHVDAVSP